MRGADALTWYSYSSGDCEYGRAKQRLDLKGIVDCCGNKKLKTKILDTVIDHAKIES